MDLTTPFVAFGLILLAHVALMPGMVGDTIGLRKLFMMAPNGLHKPLFDCLTCMAPWWSLPVTALVLLAGLDGQFWPVYLASVAITVVGDAILQRITP
ncbi:MAG TPA: hypothetical protein PLI89_12030 [Chitinophagales bacterium]|nr:hypothetical protein [Chitinophagales bacterium]